MYSDQRWILTIALVCGAAVAAAVVADTRRYRRLQLKMQEKVAVQTWEGEGGNPAPPPADRSPASESG